MKIDIQYRLARWFFGTVWLFCSLIADVSFAQGLSAQSSERPAASQNADTRFSAGVKALIASDSLLSATIAQDTLCADEAERILFYNVENAFWPLDDPEREDDEFTAGGARHWSFTRLRNKLYHLTRVILAAGGGRVPMVVGLAEVEGDSVMNFWTHRTPLRRLGYRYVVTNGPDVRGIQTAMLYHPSSFRLLHHEAFTVPLPAGERPTRQLLHAAGRLINGDTLDVIVAHMPSRMGGEKQTQAKRDAAQSTILRVADSIASVRLHPNVIMMGDMNEAPRSEIVQDQTHPDTAVPFVNLMYLLNQELLHNPAAYGTHKYQGQWSLIDHFIVHPELLQTDRSVRLSNPRIFSLPFMLKDDTSHQGQRPFRTYYGYRHEGGYSDHLPILIDLHLSR